MSNPLVILLEKQLKNIQSIKRSIETVSGKQICVQGLKKGVEELSLVWFQQIKPDLIRLDFSEEVIAVYSENFQKLLEFSKKNASKTSYIVVFKNLSKNFNSELILPLQISLPNAQNGLNILPYLEDLPVDEKNYLDEAHTCAKNDCKRASIILGWCAAIDRVHRKIEAIGFDKFNKATTDMTAKNYGRFKPYKKIYIVDSLSDIRMVFDTDLLWVLEFLQLIDSNEHERLRHCFTMRNNSGHPGDAPITGENLYSFYSDITRIILKNEKFNL